MPRFRNTVVDLPVPVAKMAQVASLHLSESCRGLTQVFESNFGQAPPKTCFISQMSGYRLLLEPRRAILEFASSRTGRTETLSIRFLGAKWPALEGMDELPSRVNYYIGRTQADWHSGVPTYARVRYRNVWPGIDVIFYGTGRQLEYDFVLAPGAHPEAIRLAVDGAQELATDVDGNLLIRTASGDLRQLRPVIYQSNTSPKGATARTSPVTTSFPGSGRFVSGSATTIRGSLSLSIP
jgi:hypothetical protein